MMLIRIKKQDENIKLMWKVETIFYSVQVHSTIFLELVTRTDKEGILRTAGGGGT